MTSMTITPNADKKKLTVAGIAAIGEPVAITVVGFASNPTADLHLRVIFQGHVVATFPMRPDDEWEMSGDDLTCVLDLNTDLARMMCRAPENCCLFTLEDTGKSDATTRRLWAIGEHELRGWPADGVAAHPYPLSKVPSLIQTWEEWIREWRTEVDNLDITAVQTATGCRIVIKRKNGEETVVVLSNGQDGQPGADGTSAIITVGQVATLPAGSQATVENVGTSTEAVFNFGIPQGHKGDKGDPGDIESVLRGETMVEQPSQRQMTVALKKIWVKLGGTLAMILLSIYALSDVTQDTEWQDVPPNMRIGSVLESAGAVTTETDPTVAVWAKKPNPAPVTDLTPATNYTDSATNALRLCDGAARPLPKYLHALDFADSYTNDAAWYYSQPQPYASCSARRIGGFLERNYDWTFDDAAEFVVRMIAGKGRFASVGVANVGTNLTEQLVTSGRWSRYYRCLPGHTVDGINENGVVAEINVVDGDPQTSGWHTGGDIHPLAAVRWALDRGESAAQVASNLAARIAFPQGWAQNFHYMIADSKSTYIVENGEIIPWDAFLSRHYPNPFMTNFPILSSGYGTGCERAIMLTNSVTSITNVWYTNAYSTNTSWLTDFDGSETLMATSKVLWAQKPKEAHRGESFESNTWWQTVHTSVYDITNRVLRVAVQETDDWYVFAVPVSGGVKPEAVREIVAPMIRTATNALGTALRGEIAAAAGLVVKSNALGQAEVDSLKFVGENGVHASYGELNVFAGESIDGNFGWAAFGADSGSIGQMSFALGQFSASHGTESTSIGFSANSGVYDGHGYVGIGAYSFSGNHGTSVGWGAYSGAGSVAFGYGAVADAEGAIVFGGRDDLGNGAHGDGTINFWQTDDPSRIYFRDRSLASITNALYSAATNYTDTATNAMGEVKADKCVPSASGNFAALDGDGNLTDSGCSIMSFAAAYNGDPAVAFSAHSAETATSATYLSDPTHPTLDLVNNGERWGTAYGLFAYTSELPVISPNDETFSNAVLAVGLNIDTNSVAVLNEIAATFGDFPITGTATTVGGLLAALAAAVAWLRKRKVDTLTATGTDITVTAENGIAKLDDFFGKSNGLLMQTIGDELPIPLVAKTGDFTAESYKRFVVSPMPSAGLTLTMHTPTGTDADVFECRFDGTALTADASVSFTGATVTKMEGETDTGVVKAGKVSLMSAFWNGATWDVNWKVEG